MCPCTAHLVNITMRPLRVHKETSQIEEYPLEEPIWAVAIQKDMEHAPGESSVPREAMASGPAATPWETNEPMEATASGQELTTCGQL